MVEEQLWVLAERQHGVVATWQVEARARGGRRAATGQWEQVTSVVLRRTGSPATPLQVVMVGVLDAGPGAVASHGTAAALWELPGFGLRPVAVMCAGRRSSRQPTVATRHRPVGLTPARCAEVGGVPVATLARTVFDLAAAGAREERVARIVNLVANRSPGTLGALHQLLDELACRGRPGIRTMRVVLAERPAGSVLPMSGLERRFEEILRERGQKPLRRQVDIGGHEWLGRVDYLDEEFGLVVEVDSVLHHSSPLDRAHDAARDRAMLDAGFRRVLRVTEEDIWYHPCRVHEAVRDARRELTENASRGAA